MKIINFTFVVQSNQSSSENTGSEQPQFDWMKSFRSRTWWGVITQEWMQPIFNHVREHNIRIKDLGKLEQSESAQHFTYLLQNTYESHQRSSRHPLIRAIFEIHKWTILQSVCAVWWCYFFEWINNHLLGRILAYIDGENENQGQACIFVFFMAFFELLSSLGNMTSDYLQLKNGNRVKIAVNGFVYKKIFKFSNSTNKNLKKGDINNLSDVDTERVYRLIYIIPQVINIPLAILMCTFTLYTIVGHLCWVALLLVMISSMFMYWISKWTIKFSYKTRKDQDKRANLLNEIIENVKVIKMNSWTQKFLILATQFRRNEYVNKFITRLLWVPQHFIHISIYWSMVIGLFMISLYKLNIPLTVSSAVMMFRGLGQMKQHSGNLPLYISFLTECMTSINRLEEYFNCDEIEHDLWNKSQGNPGEVAIKIDKSNYFWGFNEAEFENKRDEKYQLRNGINKCKESGDKGNQTWESTDSDINILAQHHLKDVICLKDIDLKIKQNEFVAIIGDIGSGKSSLLYSLLGETLYVDDSILEQFANVDLNLGSDKKHAKEVINEIKAARKQQVEKQAPKIFIDGSVSLVEQKPFILSQTVRDNILFGEELNVDRYNRVVDIWQLGRDLQILEGGDLTQIGEKGVNLSGGQKARLSIARAVYSNRDVILMDDPLSALDAHVKKQIFEKVWCRELRDKTRVLVTHSIDFLDRVDRVIVMDEGKIMMSGSFKELKDREYFKNLIIGINTNYSTKDLKTIQENHDENLLDRLNHLSDNPTYLLNNEEDESLQVTMESYIKFFSYSKITLFTIILWLVLLLVVRGFDMQIQISALSWVKDVGKLKIINYDILSFMLKLIIGILIWETAANLTEAIQGYALDKQLYTNMLNSILHAPINLYFDKTTSGTIITNFTMHVNEAWNYLPINMKKATRNVLIFFTTVWYVSYNAPICLLIIPVIFALYSLVLNNYLSLRNQLFRIDKAIHSPVPTFVNETLDGNTTIRTYNAALFEDQYYEKHDLWYSFKIIKRGLEVWLGMRTNVITGLIISFVYIYFIIYKEGVDSAKVGLIMGFLTEIQWLLKDLTNDLFWVEWRMGSFKKCSNMCEIVQEAQQHKPIPLDQNGEPWMSKGHIKFNNYSVRYRPDIEVVLKNIDIDIQPGHKIGVVGRTGAGKSTLCLALCRIMERLSGSIHIDGVDIADVGLADLRDRLTVIPQEPVLFANTLRFNLDPEHKCDDSELIDIVERAGLNSLLTRDGNGLNFSVNEKGANLSAGQKALVCICRAALRHSKVVIMDEATASIDMNTERTIQALIDEEFKESTVITVAHRLNTIMHSDKIMVMSEGKVIEYESPEKLKADKESEFTKLLNEFNK